MTPTQSARTDWHQVSADDVCAQLGSEAANGLSLGEAASRLATHGENTLPEAKNKSLLRVFAQQFASPLIYILFVAAVIAFLMDKRGDAAVILVVVFVNALIGAIQEGRAQRSMASLRKLSALKVRVRRGGQEETIE
jgi:Ca2+-transporting ATPase